MPTQMLVQWSKLFLQPKIEKKYKIADGRERTSQCVFRKFQNTHLTSLSLTNTKQVCFPSPSLEIKLKKRFSALSSAQYDILCNGYWCKIFFVFGSCIATPSTEIVSSALGVFDPSDFFNCWLNFNFWIPCLTTSIPFGLSTSVHPRNCT